MKETNGDYSNKKAIAYSFAGFSDVIVFQFFTFLIFTFYYAVVGLDVNLIVVAFIIWSIWNAINDPFLGAWSDRTSSKWGRRKPFIIAGIFPLCIITILLWTPPIGADQFTIFLYFLIIMCIWEFFYTMWSVNQTALFPEMFRDLESRAKANTFIQLFQVISLMIAFILPSFFIPKYDDPQYAVNYIYAGIAIAIIVAIGATIFILFGLKERVEFSKDPESAPSFINSLKYTFKNKSFRIYIIGNFALWYTFAMIPTILALYGSVVLGVDDSFILSLFLATALISAMFFVVIWLFVVKRFGAKNAFILAIIVYMIVLVPFMFISDMFFGFIAFFFLGIGLAGALIVRDITMGAIIDEDELNVGTRREAGYYGINGFIVKLTNVFVFISIAIVFNAVQMQVWDPSSVSGASILGLRLLMVVFPAVVLAIGLIAILRFPITKEKYEQITEDAKKLHEQKKEKVSGS